MKALGIKKVIMRLLLILIIASIEPIDAIVKKHQHKNAKKITACGKGL